jgi:DNA modification methylase
MSDMLTILCGDALSELRKLPSESVHCCVTSPPYWGLRDYSCDAQLGLEKTPEEYVAKMVQIFREVRRVLRKDGTLWLNLGDSYSGSGKGRNADGHHSTGTQWKQATNHGSVNGVINSAKQTGLKDKDLIGIPWMVAFALRADGWWLRQDIIWAKPNPMPESVTDRCTKSHEYLFMLTKSSRYFYDAEAMKEKGSYDPTDTKLPDGWDTGEGSHGTYHRNGREKGRRTDKQWGHSRRHAGFNDRWDEMEKSQQCSSLRNKRDVWTIACAPYPEAHFATYPPDLIKPCILAGTTAGDTVLDPFAGSGTTGMVALELGRKAILIELNAKYVELIKQRCDVTLGLALA